MPLVLPITTVRCSAAWTVTVTKKCTCHFPAHRHNAQLLLVRKIPNNAWQCGFAAVVHHSLHGRLPDDEVISELIPLMCLFICMLLATSALPRSLTWPSSPPRPPRFPAAFLSFSSVVHHLSFDHSQVFRLHLGPHVDCGSAYDPLPITSLVENVFMEPDSTLIHLMKNICWQPLPIAIPTCMNRKKKDSDSQKTQLFGRLNILHQNTTATT